MSYGKSYLHILVELCFGKKSWRSVRSCKGCLLCIFTFREHMDVLGSLFFNWSLKSLEFTVINPAEAHPEERIWILMLFEYVCVNVSVQSLSCQPWTRSSTPWRWWKRMRMKRAWTSSKSTTFQTHSSRDFSRHDAFCFYQRDNIWYAHNSQMHAADACIQPDLQKRAMHRFQMFNVISQI